MRGIISAAGYVPYRRLQRSEIAAFFGTGGGRGTRSVASYDEDTTTMGVEAARAALARDRRAPGGAVVRHRRSRLPREDQRHRDPRRAAARRRRRSRSTPAARSGRASARCSPRCAAAIRCSWSPPTSASACRPAPTSPHRGDGAAAILVGDDDARPGDRRAPRQRHREPRSSSTAGARRAIRARRQWEERFGETKYRAARRRRRGTPRSKAAALTANQVDRRDRDRSALARRADREPAARRRRRDRRRSRARRSARPAPRTRRCCSPTRSSRRHRARSSRWSRWPTASTCAIFRTTDALAAYRPARPIATPARDRSRPAVREVPHLAADASRSNRPPPRARPDLGGGRGPYRGVEVRVRRLARPRHRRVAPAAGARVARGRRAGRHGAGADGRRRSARSPRSRSTASPTRRARRSCSRSSTSTAAAGCRSSSPTSTPRRSRWASAVEMTFRRLFTADGIHNYFWKARPVRG